MRIQEAEVTRLQAGAALVLLGKTAPRHLHQVLAASVLHRPSMGRALSERAAAERELEVVPPQLLVAALVAAVTAAQLHRALQVEQTQAAVVVALVLTAISETALLAAPVL